MFVFSAMGQIEWELGSLTTETSEPLPQPEPSLSVSIDGPTYIDTEGTYTWEAVVSGGTGGYTYTWTYCPEGGSCSQVGTAKTYSRFVGSGDPSFSLDVDVTSGDGITGSDTIDVYVCIGCGGQLAPPARRRPGSGDV
jgi:hypothetical protein